MAYGFNDAENDVFAKEITNIYETLTVHILWR